MTGTYGQLTINSNGSYSYAANQSAADALDPGDIAYDYFTVNGDTDVIITVIGINDTPSADNETNSTDVSTTLTVTDGSSDVLAGDTDADADASLTVSQVVATTAGGSAQSVSANSTYASSYTSATGSYGTLRIGADGTYQYIASSSAGDDVFTYTVTDEFGATTTATLTITVNATNNAPVAVNDTDSITEGLTLTVKSDEDHVLNDDSDADSDTITVTFIGTGSNSDQAVNAGSTYNSGTPTAITGTYGTLTIGADGTYTYLQQSLLQMLYQLVHQKQIHSLTQYQMAMVERILQH